MRAAGLATLILTAALLLAACDGETIPEPGTEGTAAPTSEAAAASTEAESPRDRPVSFSPLPPGYRIETVVTGLERPSAMAVTPDGRLLVLEQAKGAVRVVQGDTLLPGPFFEVAVHSPTPPGFGVIELGLVGIAVDPDFEANGFVYIYYTEPPGPDGRIRSVLARVRDVGGVGVDFTELVSDIVASPSCCHVSGGIRFGLDGKLYLAVGDHEMAEEAQNLSTPFGAILRLERDGSVPADNPFVDTPNADPRIFAYGFRNPFDFAIHPQTGELYVADNGEFELDSIRVVRAGENHGWPTHARTVPDEEIALPILDYVQSIGPAGVDFYTGDQLSEFEEDLFFCQFHQGGALHWVRLMGDQFDRVLWDLIIATGCTNEVVTGADGYLYFINYINGTIYRISADETG